MAEIILDSVRVEVELTPGVWTDLANDVDLGDTVDAVLGIHGVEPASRVAGAGSMGFTLDNSSLNGLEGRYTPGHANLLANWAVQKRVRLVLSYSTGNTAIYDSGVKYDELAYGIERYKWAGRVRKITATPGKFQDRKVTVSATDWLEDANKEKMSLVPVQFNATSGEVVTALLAAVVKQPLGTDIADGAEIFPTTFDTAKDERTTVLGELGKAVISEFGLLYTKGDDSTGEVLVFEDRRHRFLDKTPAFTLTESDIMEVTPQHDVDNVFNLVRLTSFPREVDTAPSILFTLRSPIFLLPGETKRVTCRYTDAANPDSRVAGTDMIEPVVDTDYKFSKTLVDNGDLSDDLIVVVDFGGNSAEVSVTNDGTVPGNVTSLALRGTAIKIYDPVVTEARDATSIATYGERVLDLQMPYLDNPLVAEVLAAYVLSRYKDPHTFYTVGVQTHHGSEALLMAALQVEPGMVVAVSESVTALSGSFHVNGVKTVVDSYKMPYVVWDLYPVDPTDYWLIEHVTFGDLEEDTYLGP